MDLKTKALGLLSGVTSIGVIDVNWTDVAYAIGELMDLIIVVLAKLPEIAIYIAIAVAFFAFGMFFRKLFTSITDLIKIK